MKPRRPDNWTGTRNADGDRVPSMAQLTSDPTLFKSAEQQRREARGTISTGRATYKYCRDHKRVEEVTSKCFEEREAPTVDAPNVRVFQPYWDPNIGKITHNGLPVYVRSAKQRRELLKANGLVEIG